MNLQLVSNEKGKITAVLVPLKEWKDIEKKIEAYKIAESVKTGFTEMKLIQSGKLKYKSFEELLDEL